MSDHQMPLSEAVEGYDLFDKMKVQKGTGSAQQSDGPVTDRTTVVFEAWK